MPQMAPLSWFLLFLVFSVTLILFSLVNYYVYLISPPSVSETPQTATNPLAWKW